MSAPTTTILRIKRRRTETPIPCIRLEGLMAPAASRPESEDFCGGGEEPHADSFERHRSSAVLWKRVNEDGNENGKDEYHEDDENENNNGSGRQRGRPGEKYRIVNAMFVSEGDEEGPMRSSKRRKLTLLDSSTISESPPNEDFDRPAKKFSKKGVLKVLDPLTRIVDDSLLAVLRGGKTVESHYRQLTTDPMFTLRDIASQKKWLTWTLCDTGTNILHCCAIWNDPTIANEVLQRIGSIGSSGFANNHDYSNVNTRSALMEAVDGDGRTPYEMARLIGHDRVCEVLEIFGGDTSNYVYDTFYLHDNTSAGGIVQNDHSSNDGEDTGKEEPLLHSNCENDLDGSGRIMTAELTSGVAYWTPEGELVLETVDHEKRARPLSQQMDDDVDSNCEEYEANDYPDEEYDGFNEEDEHGTFGSGAFKSFEPRENRRYDTYDLDDDEFNYGGYGESNDIDNYEDYDWEQDLH